MLGQTSFESVLLQMHENWAWAVARSNAMHQLVCERCWMCGPVAIGEHIIMIIIIITIMIAGKKEMRSKKTLCSTHQ